MRYYDLPRRENPITNTKDLAASLEFIRLRDIAATFTYARLSVPFTMGHAIQEADREIGR